MREDVFAQVFRSGGVRSLALTVIDGRALVSYTTGEGVAGVVHTKAGKPKYYRIETALRFLRLLGVGTVSVDMAKWSPAMISQGELEV